RLVTRADVPGVFGFYAYDSSLAKMTLRRDTFAKEEGGRWSLVSLPTENSQPVKTNLDAAGRITRRELPDSQVVEPIDQPSLKRIWAAKNLPLDCLCSARRGRRLRRLRGLLFFRLFGRRVVPGW